MKVEDHSHIDDAGLSEMRIMATYARDAGFPRIEIMSNHLISLIDELQQFRSRKNTENSRDDDAARCVGHDRI